MSVASGIPDTPFHRKLRKRFVVFLKYYHKKAGLPPPTRIQIDIANYLQYGPKRSVIEAFRGVGKSHITGLFVIWLLLNDPLLNILVISASKNRADLFSSFVQGVINTLPGLEYLKASKDQLQSMIQFDVGPAGKGRQFPSVRSAGITGQITGSRADVIIADDVEVPNNSATQTQRDKLSEAVREFADIIKPLEAARIIYLGTPQCEDSLYNKLPARGYEIRVWPAEMPEEEDMEAYGGTLAPLLARLGLSPGQPTDPARFDELELMAKKAEGLSRYQMQYMLSTILSDAERYPLKVRDLILQACDPKRAPLIFGWAPNSTRMLADLTNVAMSGDHFYAPMMVGEVWAEYSGTVMAIDPSGKGKDETGYAIVKMLNGYLFVVAAGGLPGGYDGDTLRQLAVLAKAYSVNEIIVEQNFGDGMWSELFKPVLFKEHRCSIEEVRHSTQKEMRIIDTLEPVLNSHKLIIDPQVIEDDWRTVQNYDQETRHQKTLIYQLTRITRDRGALRHDDRLDALAIAVAFWVDRMSIDAEKGQEAEKLEARKKEIERLLRRSNGISASGGAGNAQRGSRVAQRPSNGPSSVRRRLGR